MKIQITGVPPYDGEYTVAEDRLTQRDLHTIKIVTGHVPPFDDVRDGDQDFVVAFAIIGLRRSGMFPKVDEDRLWDSELGKIVFIDEEVEASDGPPLPAPETLMTPSGAHGQTDGELPQVRSLPATGTVS